MLGCKCFPAPLIEEKVCQPQRSSDSGLCVHKVLTPQFQSASSFRRSICKAVTPHKVEKPRESKCRYRASSNQDWHVVSGTYSNTSISILCHAQIYSTLLYSIFRSVYTILCTILYFILYSTHLYLILLYIILYYTKYYTLYFTILY